MTKHSQVGAVQLGAPLEPAIYSPAVKVQKAAAYKEIDMCRFQAKLLLLLVMVFSPVFAASLKADTEIKPGTKLMPGQKVTSGKTTLQMTTEGSLVVSRETESGSACIWHTPDNPVPSTIAFCRRDGNFVLTKPDDKQAWSSGTAGKPGASIWVQDDGNVCCFSCDRKQVLWETGTTSLGTSRQHVSRTGAPHVVLLARVDCVEPVVGWSMG